MKHILIWLLLAAACTNLCACKTVSSGLSESKLPVKNTEVGISKPVAIAFMPDIHFHDIYGDFGKDKFNKDVFKGLKVSTENGTDYATIRSMQAQLQSTRLFNENYFAFIAALDDIVKRDIKYVALPGDFSDDGQPLHMRGLQKILDKYHLDYGIEFFATNGNHDPTRPFTHAAGKSDYLGDSGQEQPLYSVDHAECGSAKTSTQKTDIKKSNSVICTDEVKELGYEPIMELLGQHGFYPKESYLYFETPYSTYNTSRYDYSLAKEQTQFNNRQYEICHQGAGGKYKKPDYTNCVQVSDSSYLVEPSPGVWLLAIDANVYQPNKNSTKNPFSADNFLGSNDAGYNKVITHKTHLLEWIRSVVDRAKAQHKTLIAFSHFPMEEFYDDASEDIADLFGAEKFQLNRRPTNNTSNTFADTGLKVHVGGHMHMNDTGRFTGKSGNTLFNIQTPSLAAYAPAYKVLTLKSNQQIEVETIVLKDVPRFKELFPLYQTEWNYLSSVKAPNIWNKDILKAENYYQFTDWHLRELARLRFLPKEWPSDIRQLLGTLSGRDMLILSQFAGDITLAELKQLRSIQPDASVAAINTKKISVTQFNVWQDAIARAQKIAAQNNLTLDDFNAWDGQALSVDFYRLCNAEQLALKDITPIRLKQYQLLAQQLVGFKHSLTATNNNLELSLSELFRQRFSKLLNILVQLNQGAPNNHFLLDIQTGAIRDLADSQ